MSIEALNNTFRSKVTTEFYLFRQNLLSQSQQTILDHATEFATKSDMVTIIHETQFSEKEVRAMLAMPKLLDVMFKDYGNHSSNSMDVLVSYKADELAESSQKQSRKRGDAR